MNTLFIFNPGHDQALGNGDKNFMLPASSIKFTQECAGIMILLADEYDYVLIEGKDSQKSLNDYLKQTIRSLKISNDYKLPTPITPKDINNFKFDKIVPWGWDSHIKRKLQKLNVPEVFLPSDETLSKHRELAHRRTALRAFSFLKTYLSTNNITDLQLSNLVPLELPNELKSLTEVHNYLDKNKNIVIKSPWSGSGKGLRWCLEFMSHSDEGWCRNIIASQGSIMGEIRRSVVQDFAMEFYCASAIPTEFCGYSLFKTRNGSYEGNLIASDRQIENKLTQYIPKELLETCKKGLIDFINDVIAPQYEGHLGVDMFIYEETNKDSEKNYYLNPVVEINLRITMGLMFKRLYTILNELNIIDENSNLYASITYNNGEYSISII